MFAHPKRALYISSVLKEEVKDKMLECQTEKDWNQKLNHHTAGIISCILVAIDCNSIHGGVIYVGYASWHLAMWEHNRVVSAVHCRIKNSSIWGST